MAMPMNVTRQPTVSAAIASGSPASSSPTWLSANSQLSTVAHDGRGNQRDISTTPDMKLPAQPRPTTKRASASPAPVWAVACSSAPAVISTDRMATVMRGPTRSKAMPTGT